MHLLVHLLQLSILVLLVGQFRLQMGVREPKVAERAIRLI